MTRPYRVLLVKPRHNASTGHAIPPLGVMYLGAVARELPGVEVDIVDMTPWPMSYRDVDHKLRTYRPDLVGISAITFESEGAARVAKLAKDWNPDVPVAFGGPHATSYTELVLSDENVDVAAIGEGERTLCELIDAYRNGRRLDDIHGIAFRRNGEVVRTRQRKPIDDLDSLPIPAWDLMPIQRYKHFDRFSKLGSKDYAVVFTSRGCPYGCVYCHRVFGKRFRARSAENVFAELRTLYTRFHIREFEVIDDCFNLDRRRAERICDMIIESGMQISLTFPNGVRGDILDEQLIKKLKQAGTQFMTFAVETASPRLQKLIHKNVDLAKIKRNIDIALREGVFCQGFFMVGFPTETEEEMRKTLDFALNSDFHAVQFFVVNPFDGTPLAEWARQMGKPVKRDFAGSSYLSRDFDNLTEIPDDRFNELRKRATRRFWLDPRRMWRLFRDYPNKEKLPGFVPTVVKRLALIQHGH